VCFSSSFREREIERKAAKNSVRFPHFTLHHDLLE
jgi:hypothetical protein